MKKRKVNMKSIRMRAAQFRGPKCPACGSDHKGEKWSSDWSKRRCPFCPKDEGLWYWRDQMKDHLKSEHEVGEIMAETVCKALDKLFGPDNSPVRES
jgi:hypothetical protein